MAQAVVGASEAARDLFDPGALVADTYRIRGLLGEGATAQVFEADDVSLRRRVAIKAVRPGPTVPSLRQEAETLAAIRHSGTPVVHAFGRQADVEYLVMERLYGNTLREHIDRRWGRVSTTDAERDGRFGFTVDETIDILSGLADALVAVHAAGVAHRDVKPHNIMLCPGNRVVLTDFGIAMPEFDHQVGAPTSGSPDYMAPETILETVRSGDRYLVDLYALGVIGFELLTGSVPFEGDTPVAVFSGHLAGSIPDLGAMRDDAPPQLVSLIKRCLAKNPADRPGSMKTIASRLQALRRTPASGDEAAPASFLIVDDDEDFAEIMRATLHAEFPDATIATAHESMRAVEMVRKQPPDVLLLDLLMPSMSGLELSMYLRGTHLADRTTIVLVSGAADHDDVQVLERLGIAHRVDKTRIGQDLRPLMREIVRQR